MKQNPFTILIFKLGTLAFDSGNDTQTDGAKSDLSHHLLAESAPARRQYLATGALFTPLRIAHLSPDNDNIESTDQAAGKIIGGSQSSGRTLTTSTDIYSYDL